MTESMATIVRIWKKEKTPILIFPEWKERSGLVQMWEPVGQHGYGSPKVVMKKTRAATFEETFKVIRDYEKHYDCSIYPINRMPRARKAD